MKETEGNLAMVCSFGSFGIDNGTTTPQFKNLIGGMRKNRRAARAAHTS